MSTRYDDIWKIGETWSIVVTCTGEDGSAVNPTAADWKLIGYDGSALLSLSSGSGITISNNVVTISVSTGVQQTAIAPGIYVHRLKVTDSANAISRQIHGTIRIMADE